MNHNQSRKQNRTISKVTVIQNSCQHFESLWRRFSASLHTACCSCATAGTSSAGTGGTGSPGTEAQSVGGVIHSPGDSASDCPSPVPSPRLSLVPKARPPRGAVWFYISGSGTRFSPESPWVSETPPVRPVRAPRGTAARWSGAPARRPVRERRPLWSAFWCPACTAAHRMNSWPTPRCGDIHPPSSAARPAAHSVLSGLHRQGKTNIKKININVCFLWQAVRSIQAADWTVTLTGCLWVFHPWYLFAITVFQPDLHLHFHMTSVCCLLACSCQTVTWMTGPWIHSKNPELFIAKK